MISLRNRRALITGASRGIGALVARFMAQQGCDLVIHSRSESHTAKLVEELTEYGIAVQAVAADLADPDEVSRLLGELDQYQPIDIVFNNAAVQAAYRRNVWQTPVIDFQTSFQVNCIAPAMICYRLLPAMIERRFGRVINITSGIENEPEQAGYSASKAALEKYSRDLVVKLNKTGVLVNLADPGWCRTDLGGPDAPNEASSCLPGIALGAFVNDGRSGRIFRAQDYRGLELAQAVQQAEHCRD